MPVNDSGYTLTVGPDRNGRFRTVPPGHAWHDSTDPTEPTRKTKSKTTKATTTEVDPR